MVSLFFALGFIYACSNHHEENLQHALLQEDKIEALLGRMTLEEKIGQMSQVRHFNDISGDDIKTKFIGSVIHTDGPAPGKTAKEWQAKFRKLQEQALSTRLAIPLLLGVDAVHGHNTFDGATIFPHNIGLGATGNPQLIEEAAAITAREVQATGLNWTFSPCIAIPYNEKWGRVYEAFSESTELTQAMVKASVRGHQGNLSDPATVLATAKHFIADGATDYGKEGGDATLTMSEVRERLLPPYVDAIKEGVGAIMVSFNTLLGQSMHVHKHLITDVLKDSLGFEGIIVTDWKAFSRFGGIDIIKAGVDMVMAVDGDLDLFQSELKHAVEAGEVSTIRIDDAVRRILRQKYRLDLFENPFPNESLISDIGTQAHRKKARQAVRESLVLLKNNNNALPLTSSIGKIVVVGEHADNTGLQSGGWTISWQGKPENYLGGTTILDGIKKFTDAEVVYDKYAEEIHTDVDAAIIVVGETPYAEFMGDIGDGTEDYKLTLSNEHIEYINKYAGKVPKLIVLLVSGRPLVVSEQIDLADAFVAAWLPGSEGDGVAEVLFGKYNFTGKLPHSWPKSTTDFDGKYGPNFWDSSITPLYEIGYGLTY